MSDKRSNDISTGAGRRDSRTEKESTLEWPLPDEQPGNVDQGRSADLSNLDSTNNAGQCQLGGLGDTPEHASIFGFGNDDQTPHVSSDIWQSGNAWEDFLAPDLSSSFPVFEFTSLSDGHTPQTSHFFEPPSIPGAESLLLQPIAARASPAICISSEERRLAGPLPAQGSASGLQQQYPPWTAGLASSNLLLSRSEQEILLQVFEREIQPPAALAEIDPPGWTKIKQHLVRLAKAHSEPVRSALFSLTQFLHVERVRTSSTPRTSRSHEKLLALRLHGTACAAIEVKLLDEDWKSKHCNALLASLFLLAWFEISCDEEDRDDASFPSLLADKVVVHGVQWNHNSRHLLQWLNMFDAKASHLGGRHVLSDAAIDIALRYRSEIGEVDRLLDQTEQNSPDSLRASDDGSRTNDGQRLAALLSSQHAPTISANFIKTDIFNLLLQPAFEFHLVSQSYARRIGSQDRHHRTQDTADDAYEVMEICRQFEDDLQELWCRRPEILNLNTEQLELFVGRDIARRLVGLFSVYLATFWCHFIYIHRVAFWNFKHTPIATKALEETGKMMRRCVGQSDEQPLSADSTSRTPNSLLHPGLMWTCFLFGCEVPDPAQQQWAIRQLKALGEGSGLVNKSTSQTMGSSALSGEDRSARHALKVSALLEALVKRQTEAKCRVDGKYLCQELFGCHFYII